MMTWTDLLTILPTVCLIIWAMLMLLAGLWMPKRAEGIHPFAAIFGLAGTGVVLSVLAGLDLQGFGGMVRLDAYAVFLDALFLVSGVLAVVLSPAYLKRVGIDQYEYYPLILLSLSGMLLMASASDLIVVFLSLELLSLPLYVLAGIARPKLESEEASLKYFLLGTLASAFVLFGISFVFAATATTGFAGAAAAVKAGTAHMALLLPGAALLLIGLGFKIAVVPFHFWAPDVYQGAPSTVAAFMAVGAKAAGFAALLRLVLMVFAGEAAVIVPVFAVLAALTMFGGNLMVLVQNNLKRLLAYMGIASAGYMLMAFVPFANPAVQADSLASALFYLLSFAAASFGAWAVLVSLEQADGSGLEMANLSGLGRRAPLLAAALTMFMLSFTGIPLTLGFWGKFYLFRTAIAGGYTWLAVLGLLTSVLAAYAAFRVIQQMYFKPGEPNVHLNYWTTVVAVFCALCVLVLSFFPGELFTLAAKALIGA
jgi:NADH-quinone oxidoreductase subunit N